MLTQMVSPPTAGPSTHRSTLPIGGRPARSRRSARRSRSGRRLVEVLVDLDQARVLRMAPGHRVVFELAEPPGEGHVLGPADVLVAEEQHLVLEQQRTDLVEEAVVVRGMCQVHADELGADAGAQLFDSHFAILSGWGGRQGRKWQVSSNACAPPRLVFGSEISRSRKLRLRAFPLVSIRRQKLFISRHTYTGRQPRLDVDRYG